MIIILSIIILTTRELNVFIHIDSLMSDLFKNTEPHHSVPGLSAPFELSGLLELPKPAVSCLSNFLSIDNDIDDRYNDLSELKRV